ncbi:MAG: hypothetical protein NVS9B7_05860 [Flavisolibacter sp.]
MRTNGKYFFELIKDHRIRKSILHALPFWLASLATGLVAVGYAKLFSYAESYLHVLIHWNTAILFFLTPFCFFVAWWLVHRFAPNARGSGIPQVMAAIELSGGRNSSKVDLLLNLRIMIIKIASSLLMIFGGAAIGREGPTIQIAGSLFKIINRLIPKGWPRLSGQSFILTGAAAGLAAAFNTPLGGVVFAVEELSKIHIRHFRTALFSAVIIAGLTAQALLGPYLYLGYPAISDLRFSIFVGVALTALLSGLGGAAMSLLILKCLKWKSKLKKSLQIILFLLVAGLLIATIACFVNEKVLGSGKEIMNQVLFTQNKYESWDTVIVRILGSVISFCTGAAGGVFAPALAAGASIGAYLSSLFNVVGVNANILILAGMVGFLTGVTRSPFTAAILVLEMTDRHNVIFHLMLAAMIANLAALAIDEHSLYHHLKEQYLEQLESEVPNQ